MHPMPQASPPRSRWSWLAGGAGLLLGSSLLLGGCVPFSSDEDAMQERRMYEPVGKLLALYCQSELSLFPPTMEREWLPTEADQLGWVQIHIEPNGATLSLMGGHRDG